MFNESKNPSFITKIADLLGLNLLFILTCIPLITIGASLAAMYHVTLKMADEDRDYYVIKDYLKSFKQNFLQGSIAFAFVITLGIALFYFMMFMNQDGPPTPVVAFVLLVALTLIILTSIYIFPLIAYYENNIIDTFKHALIMTFHQMAKSILMFIIPLILIAILPLIDMRLAFMWFILSFSLTAYLQSLLLIRIFKSYHKGEKK